MEEFKVERAWFCYRKCIPDGEVVLQEEWDRGRDLFVKMIPTANLPIGEYQPFPKEEEDFPITTRSSTSADNLKIWGFGYINRIRTIGEEELQELIDICETWYQRALKAGK